MQHIYSVLMNSYVPHKSVLYWLYLGIFLVMLMVVVGGMTRLTHSGLSMVHWSITGSVPPLNNDDWEEEFSRYRQSPEYKELHSHFTLEDFKSIYWWEYVHRLLGRLLGLVFIVPFAIFLFRSAIPRRLLGWFAAIFAMGLFQGLLGWYMVQSGLVDVPRVSHYRLAAHLTTAFVTCIIIFWTTLRYRFGNLLRLDRLNVGATLFIVLILLQVVFGGFVAGLRAGWVHNTWPLMDGHFITPAATVMEPWWKNFLENKSGVQVVHRMLGYLILAGALVMVLIHKNRASYTLLGAIALQVTFGVLTLLLQVPVWLAVVHQVFALVVLLSAVYLLHQLSTKAITGQSSERT
ncbi:MAG: COX15/CtaA family protein [Salibacteraceae bacterium]